jgi:hypothetical protein
MGLSRLLQEAGEKLSVADTLLESAAKPLGQQHY